MLSMVTQMRIDILTLFPEMCESVYSESIIGRSIAKGLIDIPIEKINELTVSMQPATISASNPEAATPALRDAYRAKIVREALT